MRIENIRIGDRLYDRSYPSKRGRVTEVLKTRIKLEMIDLELADVRQVTYDAAHCQFLEPVSAHHHKIRRR